VLDDPALCLPKTAVAVPGAQFDQGNATRRAYPNTSWPPWGTVTTAETRVKVWWPKAQAADLKPGVVYDDLVKLLRDAKSGDTIRIRGDGEIAVEMFDIKPPPAKPGSERAEFKLTFEPEAGSDFVLKPAESTYQDAAVFKLVGGDFTFNGLTFQVRTDSPKDHDKLAAVTLLAASGCTFTNCTFTLMDEDNTQTAAVIVTNPSGVMAMAPGAIGAAPQVRFENCLIRGKGRGVWLPANRQGEGRPTVLSIVDTVTALDGPVVFAEPAGKPAAGGTHTIVKLSSVTALLGGPLLEMHAGRVGEMRASGLVPVEVTADRCVFAAVPGAGKPLLELDGVDPTEVKNLLSWNTPSERPNWYANFEPTADAAVFRPGDETPVKGWKWEEWLQFAKEPPRKLVGKVTFAVPPAGLNDLTGVKRSHVKVKTPDFPDGKDVKPDDAGARVKDDNPPGEEG
jgi:hypothetical protein